MEQLQQQDGTINRGAGPDLAQVNELAQGAVGLENSGALSPQSAPDTPRVDLSSSSLATSQLTPEEVELRPVKLSDLSYYIQLACEHKWSRVSAREKVFAQQLTCELPDMSTDSTQMAKPSVIKGLLDTLNLKPEDWEKATANSDLCDQLGAVRARKAAKLNLPHDASPQQVESEEELQRELSRVVGKVSKKMASIRNNLDGSVGLLRSDGSIDLGTLEVRLGLYYHELLRDRLSEAYEKISTRMSSGLFRDMIPVVVSGCVVAPLGGAYVIASRPLPDHFATVFLTGAIALVTFALGVVVSKGICEGLKEVYYKEREKSAKEEAYTQIVDDFLAANCSSPALAALQKSLGEMGVQMSLSVETSEDATKVKLHFTVPAPQNGAT